MKLKGSDGQTVRLETSDPARVPFLREIHFKVVRDDHTRFQKFVRGEIDMLLAELPPIKIQALEKSGGKFKIFKSPGLSTTYLLLNMQDPALSQKSVREALNAAIDRVQLVNFKLHGLAEPATSILPPSLPEFHARLQRKSSAGKLETKIPELTLRSSAQRAAADTAKVIAAMAGAAGIPVTVRTSEWGTHYRQVRAGHFQLALMKWVGTQDPDLYRQAFHSSEHPPGRNRGRYSSRELDQILDQADQEPDLAKRLGLYRRAQEIVFEDLPVIPLWYEMQVNVGQSYVEGFEPSLNGDFSPLLNVRKIHHQTTGAARSVDRLNR